MLLPIRQKSTINLALSPSIDQKLVWTVMFIDYRWARVSYPYFPTDDRNVSKNALPYAYWNLTRKKKVGVLTTRDSRLVSYHVFNPVGTRFHRVDFLLKPWSYTVYTSLYGGLEKINLGVLKRVARKTKIECSTEFREGFVNLEWANTVGIHEC